MSAPSITSISPTFGPSTGSTAVHIYGSGFEATPAVLFDGVTATSIVWVDAGHLTCTTPARAAGYGEVCKVVVKNPDTTVTTTGQATEAAFHYESVPVFTSMDASSGDEDGGTAFDITGTGFVDGVTSITFDGDPATDVVFVSSTHLTGVTPAHTGQEAVDVVITSPNGRTVTASGAYTYT